MPQISAAELEGEVARLRRDLAEATERQSATDEVLRIIASSPADTARVFDTIVRNFVSLCSSTFGAIYTFDGELVHFAGAHGFSPEQLNEIKAKYPVHADDRSVLSARAIRAKAAVHIQDAMADPHYDRHHAVLMGSRRMIAMPMLREGVALGAIVASWPDAGATPKQHQDLLRRFAAQAVIAIENTRLLNELRESLQQQTATADVLKVISSSPTNIQPVLDAVGENAARLCAANNAVIFQLEGGLLLHVADYGQLPTTSHPTQGLPVNRDTVTGRAVVERRTIHIHDLSTANEEFPEGSKHARRDGHRTTLATPLLREGIPVGAILIRRMEVRPFSQKQIELLTTFADQAAIAIENMRLFDEAQARTRELTEALEQQTATAEVLKVISSSPGELEPVFVAMLENAVRICGAKFGVLFRYDDSTFHPAAWRGVPPAYEEHLRRRGSFRPDEGAPLHRLLQTQDIVHTADELTERNPGPAAKVGGARSLIAVPMRKENEFIGAFVIYRTEVRAFTEKQIGLVQNFANQAVIAIENTRLLNELRESLAQQTATADVLKVSRNKGGLIATTARGPRHSVWWRGLHRA